MKNINSLAAVLTLAVLTMSFVCLEDWLSYEGNGYTVLFPKKPSDGSNIVNTSAGALKMNIHSYETLEDDADDNYMYTATDVEYPDSLINSDKKESLENFFRSSINGAVNSVHGKLLTEEIIQLDGFPGRAARIDLVDKMAVITMHAYLVGHTMYILEVITETKKDFNKSIARFMNSFKLKR